MSMFGGTFGHLRLDSWIMGNVVQLGTQRFCEKFLNRNNDPCGRQYDQMTQAARSGTANIAEGSSRRATSKETEMKLTDVARSSLAELQNDYIYWLLRKGLTPWKKDSAEACAVSSMQLDKPCYGDDVLHDACRHILAQRQKFSKWLDSSDDTVVANALLVLIGRVIAMLCRQLEAQGEVFKAEGGFRERLSTIRVAARDKQEATPKCPECGETMRRRKAKTGKNAGQEFWGCSAYPTCKGILAIEKSNNEKSTDE